MVVVSVEKGHQEPRCMPERLHVGLAWPRSPQEARLGRHELEQPWRCLRGVE